MIDLAEAAAIAALPAAVLDAHRGVDLLVDMSSIYGLVAPPGRTAYVASTFAVRGFSQALRLELAGTPVGVTTIHPGGVATAVARNSRSPAGTTPEARAERIRRFETLLTMAPDRAAEIIASAIVRRRSRVLVGADARLFAFAERPLPVSYGRVLPHLRALIASTRRRG